MENGDPLKERVENFLKLTDEELLTHTNTVGTPSSNLANAVLRHRLNKNIEQLTETTDRYSKLLALLTMILIFLGVYQILIALVQPTGNARYVYLILFGIAFFSAVYLWGNALFKKTDKK